MVSLPSISRQCLARERRPRVDGSVGCNARYPVPRSLLDRSFLRLWRGRFLWCGLLGGNLVCSLLNLNRGLRRLCWWSFHRLLLLSGLLRLGLLRYGWLRVFLLLCRMECRPPLFGGGYDGLPASGRELPFGLWRFWRGS